MCLDTVSECISLVPIPVRPFWNTSLTIVASEVAQSVQWLCCRWNDRGCFQQHERVFPLSQRPYRLQSLPSFLLNPFCPMISKVTRAKIWPFAATSAEVKMRISVPPLHHTSPWNMSHLYSSVEPIACKAASGLAYWFQMRDDLHNTERVLILFVSMIYFTDVSDTPNNRRHVYV